LVIFIDGFFMIVVDHTLDSVFELEDVKVDQEADSEIQQSEMRQPLCLVHWVEYIFTFDLTTTTPSTIRSARKPHSKFTYQWDCFLPLHMES
jgi:hypothetical protein